MVLEFVAVQVINSAINNINIKQIAGGNDFDAVVHEIVFPAGSSDGCEMCFNVTILRDNISESNQFFLLSSGVAKA